MTGSPNSSARQGPRLSPEAILLSISSTSRLRPQCSRTASGQYFPLEFEKESELESALTEVQAELFGEARVYLSVKKLIGQAGKTQNIPDGYLLELSSRNKPVLYLVEVELAVHDPLRHIAQQLLNFSLSFKSTPQKMKGILRNTLQTNAEALKKCEQYYPAGLTLPRCAK